MKNKPNLPPYADVPVRALYDNGLSHQSFRVLSVLCLFANNPDHEACPSRETLASISGRSPRSVARGLAELRKRGHIEPVGTAEHGVVRYKIKG